MRCCTAPQCRPSWKCCGKVEAEKQKQELARLRAAVADEKRAKGIRRGRGAEGGAGEGARAPRAAGRGAAEEEEKARRGARKSSSKEPAAATAVAPPAAAATAAAVVAPARGVGRDDDRRAIVGALPVSPVAPRPTPAGSQAAASDAGDDAAARRWGRAAAQTVRAPPPRGGGAPRRACCRGAGRVGAVAAHGARARTPRRQPSIGHASPRTQATGALDGKALVRISIVDASRLTRARRCRRGRARRRRALPAVKPSLPTQDAVARVHGIQASDLDGVAFTLAHAQAALAQLCSDRTVLIGHAVANDLEALRFRHGCIVDTSVAYGVVGAAAGVAPSLRDVAAAVLPPAQDAVNKSATHDSRVDARTAALCAYHLIGGTETLPKAVARRKHAREERSLFAHRIPAGVDDATLKAAVERTTGVALAADATIARGDAYGKCALVFKSPLHAQLAFDTLAGPAEEDTSGRPQKKIYLDDGGGSGKRPYCKVRPF